MRQTVSVATTATVERQCEIVFCVACRAVRVHDGQFPHARPAQPAGRANPPQATCSDFQNQTWLRSQITCIIRASRARSGGALRDRHERWARDAVDVPGRSAQGSADERSRHGRRSRVVL